PLAEPWGDDARGEHGPGQREPEREKHAVDERELPEVADHAREHERRNDEQGARRRGDARAKAIEQHAGERAEQSVKKQADRDDEGERRAIETEIRGDGLEKRPDGVTNAGGREGHGRESGEDPPAVEHRY